MSKPVLRNRRLVVVSNRVPSLAAADRPWSAGGLVSALSPALEDSGDVLWFGWSGEEGDPSAPPRTTCVQGVEYATLDLAPEQVRGYYEDYCNRVLWPRMHGLAERSAPEAAESFGHYMAVNRRFAEALLPLLRPDDLVWVHDYHLIPLGRELRLLGWQGRLGYFHHTPIPEPVQWSAMPHDEPLEAGFAAYDLVGVQTRRDARRLRAILGRNAAARVAAYPITIDAQRFRDALDGSLSPLLPEDDPRTVLFGVDRLDYTKGIPQRLEAFELALQAEGDPCERVYFEQWAAPSRTSIPEYQQEREAVVAVAERIEERYGERSPLRLVLEAQPPSAVAAALRRADICVVSSVADGMNLVAKEFAAVHSEEHPGVLIISDSCGAAEELTDAVVFHGSDPDSIARAMRKAMTMPEAERRERSRRLRMLVDSYTSTDWLETFVGDLAAGRAPSALPVAAGTRPVNEVLRDRVEQRLHDFERDGTIERIWTRDHTLWKPEPTEITNRLGWLEVDRLMASDVGALRSFAEGVAREGYTTAVLLGMGGSSYAARVFASAFAGRTPGLELVVLDSTVPGAIREVEERVYGEQCLFIVSSKSGTTLETRALLDHFWERYPDGRRFVAITDRGTPLEELARERDFRAVFLNPSDIGGRYSALSYFGLVPAALLGVDLDRLLESAAAMREACGAEVAVRSNPGARLGAQLAEAALMGRDYLALRVAPALGSFGEWLEQLIAESTGKDGRGILPLLSEPVVTPRNSEDARFFLAIGAGIEPRDLQALTTGGAAAAGYACNDPYELGAEYFRWEFGVAVAGRILGINPFDQPDVEASKQATSRLLESGRVSVDAPPPGEVFEQVDPEQYLAIHAYLPRDASTALRLHEARARLRERYRVPTSVEYGPALLHSTGQYHKAGLRRGAFLQVVTAEDDLRPIPGRDYSFEQLKTAQAAGDLEALDARGRLVTRVTLDELETL